MVARKKSGRRQKKMDHVMLGLIVPTPKQVDQFHHTSLRTSVGQHVPSEVSLFPVFHPIVDIPSTFSHRPGHDGLPHLERTNIAECYPDSILRFLTFVRAMFYMLKLVELPKNPPYFSMPVHSFLQNVYRK